MQHLVSGINFPTHFVSHVFICLFLIRHFMIISAHLPHPHHFTIHHTFTFSSLARNIPFSEVLPSIHGRLPPTTKALFPLLSRSSSPISFLSLSLSLLLSPFCRKVALLKPAKGLGSAVRFAGGSGAKPRVTFWCIRIVKNSFGGNYYMDFFYTQKMLHSRLLQLP